MKAEIVREKGKLKIAVDGKTIDTLSFKSFRPTENNVSDFYKAGIRLFNVYCSGLMSALKVPYSAYGETWFGENDYNFDSLDRQFEMFYETALEDSYFILNIHLDSRDWWHCENPGRNKSFTHLSQIAADKKWREDTANYLKALIKHCEEKHGDRVVSYFLLGGHTTEWFSDYDYEETHPIKLEAYREYTGDKNAEIPVKDDLEKPQTQCFLDPVADSKVIEYRRFHNELITDTVLYFAAAAQEVLNHNKIVGVFFGYILELRGKRLWEAGHIDYDRLYASDDIDLLATPSSYQFREYEDPSAVMLLSETLDYHNKMYFISFDHMNYNVLTLRDNPRRLSEGGEVAEALENLAKMRKDLLPTPEKTIHAMEREYMQKIYRRVGMWWFDMMEGWYYDDRLMDGIKDIIDVNKTIENIRTESAAEIAVFVSSESMYYVNKMSEANDVYISDQRLGLALMGAPYDIYSMGDLRKVGAEKYKMIFFVNAFYISDADRDYINNVLKKDGRTVVFTGPCDYINSDGVSLERVSAMTEMTMELSGATEKAIDCGFVNYEGAVALGPVVAVKDNGARSIGTLIESGKCGVAVKDMGDYKVFYSAVGNLPAELLQEMARESGVHIYTKPNVATFINNQFYGIYNAREDETEITLQKDGIYREIFSGKLYETRGGKIILPTKENPSQMLMITEK